MLGDEVGRAALHCIRCSACLNVCPVYERTGGHAYGSAYPGPIGAILSPQLTGTTGHDDPNASLPYASSLCGACYEACPVLIDIPSILVHLRAAQVDSERGGLPSGQDVGWRRNGLAAATFRNRPQKPSGNGGPATGAANDERRTGGGAWPHPHGAGIGAAGGGARAARLRPAAVDRFAETVADYRARVHRVGSDEAAGTVTALIGSGTAAIPADLPPDWVSGIGTVADEPALAVDALDGIDAVVTGCALGIAATGTIALDAGVAQGRRALVVHSVSSMHRIASKWVRKPHIRRCR